MCIYCNKSKKFSTNPSKNGKYKIYNGFHIVQNKLVVETAVDRWTAADEYYSSWGLDDCGESASSKSSITIKFCPFCGKKLEAMNQNKIFVYINDVDKGNEFCQKYNELHSLFDCMRKQRYDRSPDEYYLSLELGKQLRYKLSKNDNHIALVNADGFYRSDSNKPARKTFTEYKTYLKEGKDILIEIYSGYKHKDEVIEKLKELEWGVVVLTVDNLAYEGGRVTVKY